MIRSLTLIAVFLSAALFGACGSTAQLGSIGDEPISLREFEESFARNNGGWEKASQSTLEERKEFLDLFIKYKLKLLEARNRGLPADTAIQNELASYRTSATTSYVIEKELIEPALKMMYDRRKIEIRASHILLRLDSNPSPEDTLKMFWQAMNLIDRAKSMPFDSLARQFSQDPSVATNGGDLGWFTQGRMVRPFEDGAYSLSTGEVSPQPIRTQFGYHIIKITGRQANKGAAQLSHILKRFSPGNADSAAVRDSVYALRQKIANGAFSFENAAIEFSEDPSSKPRGGAIGTFDRGRLPADLAELLFSTPAGAVTSPYRAAYGYHIFKVVAVHPVPPFDQLVKELRQNYEQMSYAADYGQYLHSLKSRYALDFEISARYALAHSFDSTKTAAAEGWANNVDSQLRSKRLFSFSGNVFTVAQFLSYVQTSDEFRNLRLTPGSIDEIIDRIVDSKILAHHASTAGERHPAFANLMKEYENGLLIFRIDQDEIWSKIEVSDSALRAFYQTTRDKYRWPRRTSFAEIFVTTDSAANAMYRRILGGENFGELAAKFTTRPGMKEKRGEWGLIPTTQNKLTIMSGSMRIDSVSTPVPFEKGWSIIKVLSNEDAADKTFEEALPEVTNNYQEYITKERERLWIESLKSRHGVTVDPERLSDAFKKRSAS
jgi:peptidyl-prolyl cis-trans isomerase SurA